MEGLLFREIKTFSREEALKSREEALVSRTEGIKSREEALISREEIVVSNLQNRDLGSNCVRVVRVVRVVRIIQGGWGILGFVARGFGCSGVRREIL